MSSNHHKSPSLTVPLAFSIILHFAFFGYALTAPVFKGNMIIETYTVDLTGLQEELAEQAQLKAIEKKARATNMASRKRVLKKNAAKLLKDVKAANIVRKKVVPERKSSHTPEVDTAKTRAVKPEIKRNKVPVTHKRPEGALKDIESPQGPINAEIDVPPPPDPEPEISTNEQAVETLAPAAPEVYEKVGWKEIVRAEKLKSAPLEEKSETESDVTSASEAESADRLMPEVEVASAEKADIVDDDWLESELCINCEPVSRVHENLAGGIINGTLPEEDFKAVETSPHSPADVLCKKCSLMSSLLENPTEGILYEPATDESVDVVDGEYVTTLSIVEQLCVGCGLLSFIIENTSEEDLIYESPDEEFVGDVYDVQEDSMLAAIPEASEDIAEEISGPVVIEVPEPVTASVVRDSEEEDREIRIVRDSDKGASQVAEILTPDVNAMPTREEYLTVISAAENEQQKSDEVVASEAELGLPIYVRRDIEIQVFYDGPLDGVKFGLVQRGHPMNDERGGEVDITETLEEIVLSTDSGMRRMFSLARAAKGVYSFTVESDISEIEGMAVKFLLHKGLNSERNKNYESINLASGARIELRLLMPEAVFWDDDDYFTGSIEGSRFTTKFNDDTGLIWKEESVP